ncbi:M28 family peptidase [Catellatospora aurea]|uniref:M28 family peptidase n=1 Tax=Catellatospora aurea TaxID=1337874 RepID=A0ABW2HB69_9ACTN
MIASPNYALHTLDGDDSDAEGAPAGPPGSGEIEDLFERYYTGIGRPFIGRDLNGRSDYAPFMAAGIPVGGLFTGADGIKTEAEAEKFGGQAGMAYDECYHLACDTIANVNDAALEVNFGAVKNAAEVWAQSEVLPGTASRRPVDASEDGHHALIK